MNRLICVALASWSLAVSAQQVVKTFTDKGSVFVRSDEALAVGTELSVVSDAKGSKSVGKATVMEVTGALVRLALDDDATAAKGRFVKLPAGGGKAAAAPAAAAPAAEARANGRELSGHVEISPMRVVVFNDSDTNWNNCELRFSNDNVYVMDLISAHSDDGVLRVKFKGPPDPVYDNVLVRCGEGESQFFFNNPNGPGKLKGYAENTGGGSVVVHNESEDRWSRCDVIKPDKSHYVLGTLKARDQESIRSGAFKKEDEKKVALKLRVKCTQGEKTFDVP